MPAALRTALAALSACALAMGAILVSVSFLVVGADENGTMMAVGLGALVGGALVGIAIARDAA